MRKLSIIGGQSVSVKIEQDVWDVWNQFRQFKENSNEACGVLIGGYDTNVGKIFIENCTTPQKSDERKRTYFKLKAKKHQVAVNHHHKSSDGTQFYIGTWHTHPENNPKPSQLDLNDWKKCIARNRHIAMFAFAIVGTESVALHVFGQNKQRGTK